VEGCSLQAGSLTFQNYGTGNWSVVAAINWHISNIEKLVRNFPDINYP
jgi:hypothetical protein